MSSLMERATGFARKKAPHEPTVTCKRVQDRLSDYVDGDLGPLAMLAMRVHLRHCESCRTALASLERTLTLLRRCKVDREPPGGAR